MLTEFGKFLKKLRIDKSETLAVMAGKLGISAAYLSSIENGTRDIPGTMISTIMQQYHPGAAVMHDLLKARSATPNKMVEIELASLPPDPVYQQTALMFETYLHLLDRDVVRQIYDIIEANGPYKNKGVPGIIGDDS